jgi:hypothetical protein
MTSRDNGGYGGQRLRNGKGGNRPILERFLVAFPLHTVYFWPIPRRTSRPGIFPSWFMVLTVMTSRARLVAAIALAMLAVGWFAPARATASCGDYVARTPGGSMPAHPEAPRLPDQVPDTPLDARLIHFSTQLAGGDLLLNRVPARMPAPCVPCQGRPARPDAPPCEGPWCSGSHRPLTPPPSPVQRPHEQWPWCGTGARPDASEALPHAGPHGQADRVHHVFPVFHPPRPA